MVWVLHLGTQTRPDYTLFKLLNTHIINFSYTKIRVFITKSSVPLFLSLQKKKKKSIYHFLYNILIMLLEDSEERKWK